YYLIQSNPLTSAPTYSFRLLDLAAAQALTLNATTSGTLNPGDSATLYSFSGSAGQRVLFNTVSGQYAYVALYGPTAQEITNTTLGNLFQATLPTAGTYTVGIEGWWYNTSPVAYSFQVLTPTTNSNAYTLGTTVSGNIAAAGQLDKYTFSGSAGHQLYFDGLSSAANLSATLLSPSGSAVLGGDFFSPGSHNAPITLA